MEILYELRETVSKDWASLLFVLCLVLVTLLKTFFETRFNEFIRLSINDKYLKIYKDSSNLLDWFTIALFALQLISFTFFTQLVLHSFGYVQKNDGVAFIQIFTLLSAFILSKYLIEKIIAASFAIGEFIASFNLYKINYRALIGLFLLPVSAIFFFNTFSLSVFIYIFISMLLFFSILTYLKALKAHQSLIIPKLFYFILYLCALEIAPYYFIYYWFTRS